MLIKFPKTLEWRVQSRGTMSRVHGPLKASEIAPLYSRRVELAAGYSRVNTDRIQYSNINNISQI